MQYIRTRSAWSPWYVGIVACQHSYFNLLLSCSSCPCWACARDWGYEGGQNDPGSSAHWACCLVGDTDTREVANKVLIKITLCAIKEKGQVAMRENNGRDRLGGGNEEDFLKKATCNLKLELDGRRGTSQEETIRKPVLSNRKNTQG